MKIEEVFSEWEKDGDVSPTNLDVSSLAIAKLHHKYYKMLGPERFLLKKLEADAKILYRQKVEYYTGTLDHDEMKELGWEPWPRRLLKSDVNTYIESDKDVIELNLRIAAQREKVDLITEIIKMISIRGIHIKNAIDFLKFKNGM